MKATSLKKITKRTTLDEKISKRRAPLAKTNGHLSAGTESIEVKSEDESTHGDGNDDDGFESDDSISKSGPTSLKKKPSVSLEDDIYLSDDELQKDALRVKEKKGKKAKRKKGKVEVDNNDEEADESSVAKLEADADYVFETDLSFHQMNLSRPLLKVTF